MWDLIVSVPDHYLSFYFSINRTVKIASPVAYIIHRNSEMEHFVKPIPNVHVAAFKMWNLGNTVIILWQNKLSVH